MHSGEKSNKCNQCNYESSLTSNLRMRLKIHSGEKSNKCNQCNCASFRAYSLRIHLKTHSSKKSNVKIHNGERSNKCNQRDFAISRANNLMTHLKTHGWENWNKCNQVMCHAQTNHPNQAIFINSYLNLTKSCKIEKKLQNKHFDYICFECFLS